VASAERDEKIPISCLQVPAERGVVVPGAAIGLISYGLIILFQATVEYLLMVENSCIVRARQSSGVGGLHKPVVARGKVPRPVCEWL